MTCSPANAHRLVRAAACACLCLAASACGSEEAAKSEARGAGAASEARSARADRAEAADESAAGRFEVIGSSTSNVRPSAGEASADDDRSGGGSAAVDDAEAARRRENQARCDRLVEHMVNLTGDRMGSGATREAIDKLEAQTDELRRMCASSSWLPPDYESCALRATTLDQAIACSAQVGPRAAKAYEKAQEMSTRKDLLEEAERKIEAGEVPEPTVDVRPDRNP